MDDLGEDWWVGADVDQTVSESEVSSLADDACVRSKSPLKRPIELLYLGENDESELTKKKSKKYKSANRIESKFHSVNFEPLQSENVLFGKGKLCRNQNSQPDSPEVVDAPKVKKKRKRRNKTQALAECQVPVEPITEFLDVLKTRQDQMTVIERDELDIESVNLVQEPLNDTVDLMSALQGSLARCGSLLSRPAKPKGYPFILIVAASAMRVMDLKRNLQKVSPDCKVMKLFAKHMKIGDQMRTLEKTPTQVVAGTPKRIHELIDLGALKLSKLKYILLDWTWRDSKLRRLGDIAEIKHDLMSLLFKHLLAKSIKYNTQVILL